MSVSVCIQRLQRNLAGDRDGPNLLRRNLVVCWRNYVLRSNSLFHDLAVRSDRLVEAVRQNDHPRPGLACRSRS